MWQFLVQTVSVSNICHGSVCNHGCTVGCNRHVVLLLTASKSDWIMTSYYCFSEELSWFMLVQCGPFHHDRWSGSWPCAARIAVCRALNTWAQRNCAHWKGTVRWALQQKDKLSDLLVQESHCHYWLIHLSYTGLVKQQVICEDLIILAG